MCPDSRLGAEVSELTHSFTYLLIQIIKVHIHENLSVFLYVQVSRIADSEESVMLMLGRCLPHIVPNVLLAKREVTTLLLFILSYLFSLCLFQFLPSLRVSSVVASQLKVCKINECLTSFVLKYPSVLCLLTGIFTLHLILFFLFCFSASFSFMSFVSTCVCLSWTSLVFIFILLSSSHSFSQSRACLSSREWLHIFAR